MTSLKGLSHMCFCKNVAKASEKCLGRRSMNNCFCLFETIFEQLFPMLQSFLFIYLLYIRLDE